MEGVVVALSLATAGAPHGSPQVLVAIRLRDIVHEDSEMLLKFLQLFLIAAVLVKRQVKQFQRRKAALRGRRLRRVLSSQSFVLMVLKRSGGFNMSMSLLRRSRNGSHRRRCWRKRRRSRRLHKGGILPINWTTRLSMHLKHPKHYEQHQQQLYALQINF